MRKGSHLTDEQKERDSAALMGHAATGPKHHTAEARAKMSVGHMGNKSNLGRHLPAETRAKISAAERGHIKSPETRAKMSATQKGKTGVQSRGWKGGKRMANGRSKAKRREFGYVHLNDWFFGCEGHHVDNEQVIHMPKTLHRGVFHRQRDGLGVAQMNAVAYNFLFKQEVEAAIAAKETQNVNSQG